jgi:hypothetical protein
MIEDVMKHIAEGVFRVGEGRGFKVGDYVITAAHCLPQLPSCAIFVGSKERAYPRLLGRLGHEPTVWAELLFADPISDLAILGSPDDQVLFDEAEAYDQFLSAAPEFTVADIEPDKLVRAKVLSLSGEWLSCMVHHCDGPLWLEEPVTEGGMSGSPIIDDTGRAIGVVCSGASTPDRRASLSMNCRLMHSLPRWFDVGG